MEKEENREQSAAAGESEVRQRILGEICQEITGKENPKITPEQLGQLIPGGLIDKSSERREMKVFLTSANWSGGGRGEKKYCAATYNSRTEAISFYQDFFSDLHQKHIFAHEISEAIISRLLDGDFWLDYQRIVDSRDTRENADYIYWLCQQGQNSNLIVREQLADDLADFLRSKNSEEMAGFRQQRLTTPNTLVDSNRMKQLYDFFAKNLQIDERLAAEEFGELEELFSFPEIIDVPAIEQFGELPAAPATPQGQSLGNILRELWAAATRPS